MITHIKTKGLKGQDIDEPVSPKTIYIGPNGSGKSTRAQAIALVVMGYIPWATKPKKKPADILAAYGSGEMLTVTGVIGDTEFERKFSRANSGSVSQRLRINKRKAGKDEFPAELVRVGSPKILDLGAFIDLSDQKKIDLIFSLFPPAGDVTGLDSEIEKKTDELNALNRQSKNIEGTIQRLLSSKGGVEMPSGTLAEVQQEIETLTNQMKEAQSLLTEAEIEQARIETEEKAKEEVEEKQGANPEIPPFFDEKQEPEKTAAPAPLPPQAISTADPVESIQAILNALESAGCGTCAAKLVAKRELRKYQRRTAA